MPEGTFAAIFARSGLATNEGLRPANCVGVCDSDYRGNYIVALHNDTDENRLVSPGERIAQMVLLPYISMQFEEVYELGETERSSNGFGSIVCEMSSFIDNSNHHKHIAVFLEGVIQRVSRVSLY